MAAIDDVFPPEILLAFAARLPNATPLARHRYEVVTAHGPYPSDDSAAYILRQLRAQRAAWEAYLDAAAATGLLDTEMTERMRSDVDHNIRSARAECLAAWFFVARRGVPITPRPRGRGASVLEFRVEHGSGPFNVEVKAPFVERPTSGRWSGNDAEVLEACFLEAQRQFDHGTPNVLVIVPQLRVAVAESRMQFVEAFIGRTMLAVPVSLDGSPVPEPHEFFRPDGRLARQWGAEGARYTRVSAVVVIEERYHDRAALRSTFTAEQLEDAAQRHDIALIESAMREEIRNRYSRDELMTIEHEAAVIHNPFASLPIGEDVFAPLPRFVRRERDGNITMHWTDQHTEGEEDAQ